MKIENNVWLIVINLFLWLFPAVYLMSVDLNGVPCPPHQYRSSEDLPCVNKTAYNKKCKVTEECATPNATCRPVYGPEKICHCSKEDYYYRRNDSCTPILPCPMTTFPCRNKKKCISLWLICDGEKNCADGSDEVNCTVPQGCNGGLGFPCPYHNQCFSKLRLCDGEGTCGSPVQPSNPDEQGCDTPCKGDYFKCARTEKCVHVSKACDNIDNCKDGGPGSDEENCKLKDGCNGGRALACPEKCLSRGYVCYPGKDCKGKSDEKICDRQPQD